MIKILTMIAVVLFCLRGTHNYAQSKLDEIVLKTDTDYRVLSESINRNYSIRNFDIQRNNLNNINFNNRSNLYEVQPYNFRTEQPIINIFNTTVIEDKRDTYKYNSPIDKTFERLHNDLDKDHDRFMQKVEKIEQMKQDAIWPRY